MPERPLPLPALLWWTPTPADRIRLGGGKPDSATRLVSLHDPDARPIAKGRLGKPIEFGYKAQIVDNADGIVLDHTVEKGNPPDAPQLAPAIERITHRTGRPPRAVAADRGYGEAGVEADLHDAGVTTVAIPRKGRPGTARQTHERQPGFRRLVKWRTGCEGRISHLKHRFDLDRTRLDGLTGVRIWCGYGVLAHNLTKVTALAAVNLKRSPHKQSRRRLGQHHTSPATPELTSSGRSN